MSEPGRITFNYSDEADLHEQVAAWLRLSGYHVERVAVPPVSVGELARLVGRSVSAVSQDLHRGRRRGKAPPFDAEYGKGTKRRRILRLVPHEGLIHWLKVRT